MYEVDKNHDNKISYPEFLALWENKNEERRDVMMDELRAHRATLSSSSYGSSIWGGSVAGSSHHASSYDASDPSDHSTLARANYLEGKQLSDRRVKKYAQVNSTKERAQRMFISATEDDAISPVDAKPEPIAA